MRRLWVLILGCLGALFAVLSCGCMVILTIGAMLLLPFVCGVLVLGWELYAVGLVDPFTLRMGFW